MSRTARKDLKVPEINPNPKKTTPMPATPAVATPTVNPVTPAAAATPNAVYQTPATSATPAATPATSSTEEKSPSEIIAEVNKDFNDMYRAKEDLEILKDSLVAERARVNRVETANIELRNQLEKTRRELEKMRKEKESKAEGDAESDGKTKADGPAKAGKTARDRAEKAAKSEKVDKGKSKEESAQTEHKKGEFRDLKSIDQQLAQEQGQMLTGKLRNCEPEQREQILRKLNALMASLEEANVPRSQWDDILALGYEFRRIADRSRMVARQKQAARDYFEIFSV